MNELFDPVLRRQRRDRAALDGAETFLHERALDDMLDRLVDVGRSFERPLLIGCPSSKIAERIRSLFPAIAILDPSPVMAELAGGRTVDEAALEVKPGSYDLLISLMTIDTINALPEALLRFRLALEPGGLLIGAAVGGESLPHLGRAMVEADRAMGGARAHLHPRIDPGSLTLLLAGAGFSMPVVDIDRVTVRYGSFDRLVADLRAMGATNILTERASRPLNREAVEAARAYYRSAADEDGKTGERFDILHFMGWAPDATGSAPR